MRIPNATRITSGRGVALASALCIAAGLGFGTVRGPVLGLSIAPAFAFDGTTTPNTAALTPSEPRKPRRSTTCSGAPQKGRGPGMERSGV